MPVATGNGHPCKYCGRSFASKVSMYRHIRQSCKIANSEEGMEKLMEHTIQRQLAEQSEQIAELTALLKGQLASGPTNASSTAGGAVETRRPPETRIKGRNNTAQVNTGTINNTTVQVTNIVMKPPVPWDGERRISVTTAQMMAALEENARLRDYVSWPTHELTDPDKAPPYVAELFMDLTKRAHADPTARNVYLNPRRTDQALVHMATGKWEVLPLAEATRLMFDGVAQSIHKTILSNEERQQLPPEAQNALSLAEMMYQDEPDEYAKKAKAPMAAHLTNTVPLGAAAQICQ